MTTVRKVSTRSVGLPGYAAKRGVIPYGSTGSTGTPSGSAASTETRSARMLSVRQREVRVLLGRAERQDDPVIAPEVLLQLHPVAVLDAHERPAQTSAGSGSGRTRTVSATGMISSTGRIARDACSRIASGLVAW